MDRLSWLADRRSAAVAACDAGDVAGYHYYPGRDRAVGWLTAAGLEIVDEGLKQEDGWAYRHFLLRSTP